MTMARVNRLFGVTMPEQGVSQLVSVDLEKQLKSGARRRVMVNDEKLQKLKERIDTAETTNSPPPKQKKQSGADLDLRLVPEIIAALVVGVGIGLIVDKYLGKNPLG